MADEQAAGLACGIIEGARAERLLLLLHGLGADENDLAPAVSHLDPEGRFTTLLPRGPLSAPPGYAWFPFGPGAGAEIFAASVTLLSGVLDEACRALGLPRETAVVAGFSQGGCMALCLGYGDLDGPRPAGVLSMSGFLPRQDFPLFGSPAPEAGWPPALVQHGTEDPLVPLSRGAAAASLLSEHGVPTVFRRYPMSHSVTIESLADAREWLAAVCAGEAPSDAPS